jgi:hypothetical protein
MRYLALILLFAAGPAMADPNPPYGAPPGWDPAVRAANTKAALDARQEYLDNHPNDPDRSGDHKGHAACIKTDGSYDVYLAKGPTCP